MSVVSISDLAYSLADELDNTQDWLERQEDFGSPGWKAGQVRRLRDELTQALELEAIEHSGLYEV